MTDQSPYHVPKEPGRWRAISLAAAVHAALLVFFWIGIDWQSETPIAVQAEIWDLKAREAAPLPDPKPQPKPEPKPEPKPAVKPPPPKVEPDTPPVPKVDIALEKEKKRKEQERKDKLAEQQKQELLKKQKAEEDARKEKAKAQAAKEQAEKEKQKKIEQDKKRQQEAAQLKAAKAEEMRRLTEAVGSGGAGKAEKSTGIGRADASYLQKIGARIRSNTIFNVPEGLSGNPAAEYDVELLPDGSVRGLRLRKSSGLPGFDESVKRAIELSQPFPPDNSGRVPSSFTVVHKPKDQ
tara:strand:+ start:481819 stop:482700 length:882 start_codon:yes stop_codon:yes gene_type:complete